MAVVVVPPSQVKSTQFSDRGGMQGLVDCGTVVSAQPMPKVAYRSGSRDQHDHQR